MRTCLILLLVVAAAAKVTHYKNNDGYFFLDTHLHHIQGDIVRKGAIYHYQAYGDSLYQIKYQDTYLFGHFGSTAPQGILQPPLPRLLLAFTGFQQHFSFNQDSSFDKCGVKYANHQFTPGYSRSHSPCRIGYIIVGNSLPVIQIGSAPDEELFKDTLQPDDRMEGVVVWY